MSSTAVARRDTNLQLSLYSGIALIVLSMLFLGRQQAGDSFLIQAIGVLAAPAIFYLIGILVYRYLRAPLAAPGIIATGAWLVAVGLIHLYDKRLLLPAELQPYYWFGASLIAGALITITGHRVHIWLLVPLVPLVQVNAMWATMSALGAAVEWMPALSFMLALIWWELPLKSDRWTEIYHFSAVLLTVFLLVFSLWLPMPPERTLMTTWGAGALLIAVLGLRHGWTRLGSLTIAMLVCASIWGLPAEIWPLVWLALAAATIILIERMTRTKDIKAVELSLALAVLLCGAAAFFAEAAPLLLHLQPAAPIPVLAAAGILLVWLGWQRDLRAATHAGLWLSASAWASLYFVAAPTSGTYGLWLTLLSACALLLERLLTSFRKEKRKAPYTLSETVVRWPFADLVIGLSAAVLLWTALEISALPAWLSAITLSLIVGVWVAAGLLYRLPILLHIALWIAIIPYSLLLILAAPSIWTLPLLGGAWQILGLILLIFGHSTPKYRPALLAPFFIVGYGLIGLGLLTTLANPMLVPFSLGLVVLVSIATSAAVIFDFHPAWDAFVEILVSPDQRPYAFMHIHNLFLFLSAWFAAIWLQLMLGYTGLPLAQQGIFLVVFAGLWFVLGRLLGSVPGVVGWPVTSAGWLLWLIGLLQVFYSPADAIIVMILGLVISGEALHRSRSVHWIPVFALQIFFSVLQIARMLSLPGSILLLTVAIAISAIGLLVERQSFKAGRMTAATGAALALATAILQYNVPSLIGITVLAVIWTLHFRRWQWLWAIYAGVGLTLLRSNLPYDWRILFVAGVAQWIVGAELLITLQPRRYTQITEVFQVGGWGTPLLWVGTLCGLAWVVIGEQYYPIGTSFLLAVIGEGGLLAVYAVRLRVRKLPYLALGLFILGVLLSGLVQINHVSFSQVGGVLIVYSLTMSLIAIMVRLWVVQSIRQLRPFRRARWLIWWLRSLLAAAHLLSIIAFSLMLVNLVYPGSSWLKTLSLFMPAIYVALVFWHSRQIGLLWIAFGLGALSWMLLLHKLTLYGILWQTVPMGIVLLALARFIPNRTYFALELAGTLILLTGSVYTTGQISFALPALLIGGLHAATLATYGIVGSRRIPFTVASSAIIGGIVFSLLKLNIWLIPLASGVLLISATLFVETRREIAEQWTGFLLTRWQQWK